MTIEENIQLKDMNYIVTIQSTNQLRYEVSLLWSKVLSENRTMVYIPIISKMSEKFNIIQLI